MKKYAALKGAMNGGPGDEDKKKRKTILGGSSNSNYNPNEYEPVESDDLRKAREGQERGEGIVVLRRHQHKEIEQAKKQGKTVYVPNERLIPKKPVEPVREEREIPTLPTKRISPIMQQAREKIEVPEGPGYSQPNYTRKGIAVGVHPGRPRPYKVLKIRRVGGNKVWKATKYYSLPIVDVYRGIEKKKLIPSIVQKATGYDKKKMEGYENEEGVRVPGEIERAQNEDRQIKFTGASSIKDLIAQRKYNKQYPEWDKKTKSARMYNAMLANKE
jgi:hypothetical protein